MSRSVCPARNLPSSLDKQQEHDRSEHLEQKNQERPSVQLSSQLLHTVLVNILCFQDSDGIASPFNTTE